MNLLFLLFFVRLIPKAIILYIILLLALQYPVSFY